MAPSLLTLDPNAQFSFCNIDFMSKYTAWQTIREIRTMQGLHFSQVKRTLEDLHYIPSMIRGYLKHFASWAVGLGRGGKKACKPKQ